MNNCHSKINKPVLQIIHLGSIHSIYIPPLAFTSHHSYQTASPLFDTKKLFRKITNHKSPITDNKFRRQVANHARPVYSSLPASSHRPSTRPHAGTQPRSKRAKSAFSEK